MPPTVISRRVALAALLGTTVQARAGAISDSLSRGTAVSPESYKLGSHRNYDVAINRAFETAANAPSFDQARPVLLTDWYDVTSIQKASYVPVIGVGRNRCGLRPTLKTGYGLTDVNQPGYSLFQSYLADFGLDGARLDGDAGLMLIDNEQHVVLDRLGFTNTFSGGAALRIVGGCYGVTLNQPYFRANTLHIHVGSSNRGADDYPNNIVFNGGTIEGGLRSDAGAVVFQDAMGIIFRPDVFQSNAQKYGVHITKGAGPKPPRAAHQIAMRNTENNTGGQAGGNLIRIEGLLGHRVDTVFIERMNMANSGAGPAGGNLYSSYTDRVICAQNSMPPGEIWLDPRSSNNTNMQIGPF